MHRTVLATLVAFLTAVWLAGGASAADLPSHRAPQGRAPSARAATWATQPGATFQTLGAKLAGAAVVNGHVYAYDGAPIQQSYVYGEAYDRTVGAWIGVETYSDGSGSYTLSGLPAADASGYLAATSSTEPWVMRRIYASWSDPGPTTFDFRPGKVPTTLVRGTIWSDWESAESELFGVDARSSIFAESLVPSSGGPTTVGDSYALGGSYSQGALYFWADQGLEHVTAIEVTAGARSVQSVTVSQNDAQRISVTSPYWASGKPGTTVTVKHWNFPAGWNLGFSGWPDAPMGNGKAYGSAVAPAADSFTRKFTVQKTAPAGYSYHLETDHADGPLLLHTPFQVCTLKSTKASIKKGGSIKLSGVIPTQGHWGSRAGKSKKVTIYQRSKSVSAAPTTWDATKQGWKKVATVTANGLGKYASASLKPTRTTWYVVRYPGDDWYWRAYTSVVKVRVN